MNLAGVLLAVVPAIVGSIAWALLFRNTHSEFAFLAWAIGAGVGAAASFRGSRSMATAIVCIAFALSSIAGGKLLAMKWTAAEGFAHFYREEWLSYDVYKVEARDAIAFGKITGEGEYRDFIAERNYSALPAADQVTSEDLDDFKTYSVPWLEWMLEERPSYAEWRAELEDSFARDAESAGTQEAAALTLVEIAGYAVDAIAIEDVLLVGSAAAGAAVFGYGLALGPKP